MSRATPRHFDDRRGITDASYDAIEIMLNVVVNGAVSFAAHTVGRRPFAHAKRVSQPKSR